MSTLQGEVMEALHRERMSYEDYLALPESMRAEWVDGEVVWVSPSASHPHQKISFRLAALLDRAFPHLDVVEAVTTHLPGNRERIPDVIVAKEPPAGIHFVEETPLLVAEILSPATRTEDTVRKSAEYLAAGIEQYWVVDPRLRSIEVLRNRGDAWESMATLDDAHATASVALGGFGSVDIDLAALLPPVD